MMNSTKLRVLIVDGEPLKRVTLQVDLQGAGYEAREVADASAALTMLAEGPPVDVVVVDFRLPGADGLTLLDEVKHRWPATQVILTSADATVETAVDAIKRGAYDCLVKPFPSERLLERLERLERHCGAARPDAARAALGQLVGPSAVMQRVFTQLRQAAEDDAPVLLVGEAGTGKTLAAETIHQLSHRRAGPLVRVNVEALTQGTAASELFGAAVGENGPTRTGRVSQARGGTLLIENINALALPVQARLVSFLESNHHAGGDPGGAVDLRLICTSRVALEAAIRDGAFRDDLRLRVAARTVVMPRLRDRREDIPALARAMLDRHVVLAGRAPGSTIELTPHASDVLVQCDWPGNVMELEHALEQALTRCGGEPIRPEHLAVSARSANVAMTAPPARPEVGDGLARTVANVERTLIQAALRTSSGNQAQAAQLLRIPRTTLRDKMSKYGLVGDTPSA